VNSSSLTSKETKKFAQGKGNIAFADYEISGRTGTIQSFSGESNLSGFSPFVSLQDRILKTVVVGTFNRAGDTEAKILEQILAQTTPDDVGTIRLFTMNNVCASCGIAIEEFVRFRPGIKIEVVEGK
jgi:hypothetical protein